MALSSTKKAALLRDHKSEISAQNALVHLTGEAIEVALTSNTSSGTTGTTTSVGASLTAVTLKAANSNRKSIKIINNGTAILYVREGAGASTALFTWKLAEDESVYIGDYSGEISGIWNLVNGTAVITETI